MTKKDKLFNILINPNIIKRTTYIKKAKKKTKPRGRNPKIIQRNKDIQKAYYKLREEQGYTAKRAKEMLAEKYEFTYSTIETILKKAP